MLLREISLLFCRHWWLLILFVIILATSDLKIHHEFLCVIQEHFIVVHSVLIDLHLTSLIVIFNRWVYGCVTAQVSQLIVIKLLQSLFIEILPLNTWQLFRSGAAFNVGLPCHPLLIDLSEDLSDLEFFFN